MEILEFYKAFDVNELKGIIDKAMLTAVPVSVKQKWRNLISMMLMNQNPTLAYKIKMWDVFVSGGYTDATQDMACFTNKIFKCPDITVVRNIVYVEDAWVKWSNESLLLSKDIANKRDSEGILDAMLKVIDNGSHIGSQVRALINDHPQVDARYKHFDAAIEKVLYNNGKLVSTNYTVAPDGVNVTVGGRKFVCGSGNGYYLDARGALRISPKWRLIFLPDGNFAVEDSSHACVIQGDLGTIAGFCCNNFGIDIVKVLRDNNIEANLSNNTSVASNQVTERIHSLLEARQEAVEILEEIERCIRTTTGNYEHELTVAEGVVKKKVNAIDVLLYHYDIDPETGCPLDKNKGDEGSATASNPAGTAGDTATDVNVNEDIQPLFDTIGNIDKEHARVYDLLNQIASDTLEPKTKDSDEWVVRGTFKDYKFETIPTGIYGVNQIVEVKELSKTELECKCMRIKGDIDDTYTEWYFKIDKYSGDYTVTLFDNIEEYSTIFDIYPNAKAYAATNATKIKAFMNGVSNVVLGGITEPEPELEPDNTDGDGNAVTEGLSFSVGDVKDDGKNYIVEVSASGLKALVPIISKYRPSNKSVAIYNGSVAKPLIEIINSDIKRSTPIATITFDGNDKAIINVPKRESIEGLTIGKLFDIC